MNTAASTVEIHRSADRRHLRYGWLDAHHSFPMAGNFDLDEHAHGLLMVHNEDTVFAGEGFDTHPHEDMEIVTWVLSGSLVHQDSAGHSGLVRPGLAQRMGAGSGILHSERNDSIRVGGERVTDPVHLVQMWVPPDESGLAPEYQELDVTDELTSGHLVTVASGLKRHAGETAIGIRNRHTAFYAARLEAGQTVTVPEAPYVHVFIARGEVQMEGSGTLHQGDAVRMTSTGGQRISATESTEVLIWEMHAGFAHA